MTTNHDSQAGGDKGQEKEFHAVEYSGFFNIQTTPFYDDADNILDAESVGYENAKGYAKLIAKLLNEHFNK